MFSQRSGIILLHLAAFLASDLGHLVKGCGYPGSPSHSLVTFTPEVIRPGTVATYECEPGFELLGPSRRICSSNNTWTPAGIPFCVINVAAGKAPMQSSIAQGGVPEHAVDGSTSNFFDSETCSMTEPERAPWWYVNLLEPYMVQLVRLDFGQPCCGNNKPANIVVRVGNSRPDLGVNPVCNRFTGHVEEGRPLFLPCNPPMPGAFVSVHLETPGSSLSICEAFVYTDQALPMERCPQFRDQEPGSTATYNGKCYMFHNQQPLSFNEARQFCEARGGSLVDETNPALQGFISWELWRRHSRGDPSGQYWMGAIRDPEDRNNWKWLTGRDVTVSFWNLPGGNDDCARFDGTKGWLWSDTNCNLRLFYICQHRPKSCGRPEQPANSSLVTETFDVGTRIEYSCDSGHMAVGPVTRTCMATGFYSEYPPVCKYVQCGLPARIPNGAYKLVNGTRHYLSTVRYSCTEGFQLIGRAELICDVDGRWNGPPPRCEPVVCMEPPEIRNGGFRLSGNSTLAGTVVTYYCLGPQYKLSGPSKLICQLDGHYDRDAPVCIEIEDDPAALVPNTVDRIDTDMETIEYSDDYYDDEPTNFSTSTPSTTSSTKTSTTTTTTTSTTTKAITTRPTTTVPKTSSTTPRGPTPTLRSQLPPVPRRNSSNSRQPNYKEISRVPSSKKTTDVLSDLAGPVFLPPKDNEIADSANVRTNLAPNVNEPKNKIESGNQSEIGRLNLGGIIALGVFGGFVFLAAIITTFVIVIRRVRNGRRYQRRAGSSGSHSATTFESSSNEGRGGLNKYYRQAWENLRDPAVNKGKGHRHDIEKGRKETLDDTNYNRSRMEGVRDEGEMVVAEVYPKENSGEKKRHHHHHHHHKHGKRNSQAGQNEW